MQYVCDLQGFKEGDNKFILKEISAVCLEDGLRVTHLFEPPYPWSNLSGKNRAVNNWLTRHYHNLSWDSGLIPYELLEDVVTSMLYEATIIYVKGAEKKTWLRNIIGNGTVIFDLHDLGCSSLSKLREEYKCPNHTHDHVKHYNCARRNVELLSNWILNESTDL